MNAVTRFEIPALSNTGPESVEALSGPPTYLLPPNRGDKLIERRSCAVCDVSPTLSALPTRIPVVGALATVSILSASSRTLSESNRLAEEVLPNRFVCVEAAGRVRGGDADVDAGPPQ